MQFAQPATGAGLPQAPQQPVEAPRSVYAHGCSVQVHHHLRFRRFRGGPQGGTTIDNLFADARGAREEAASSRGVRLHEDGFQFSRQSQRQGCPRAVRAGVGTVPVGLSARREETSAAPRGARRQPGVSARLRETERHELPQGRRLEISRGGCRGAGHVPLRPHGRETGRGRGRQLQARRGRGAHGAAQARRRHERGS